MESQAQKQQGKAMLKAADAQEKLAERQASSIAHTAMSNRIRGERNADSELGMAVADAGASNLLREGSTLRRETDLATRLQDDIANQANAALEQGNNLRTQAAYTGWDMRNQAANLKRQSKGTLISAAGSLFGNLAKGL